MVIVQLGGGLSNQIGLYAVGRYLAYRLNTELKLDLRNLKIVDKILPHGSRQYRLRNFNIQENFATPEEIAYVKENGIIPTSLPDLENFQGDILVQGNWMHGRPFLSDIINIFRQEFTLRNPLSQEATNWKRKILSAKCSVAMHFRHGDYAYSPRWKGMTWSAILPLDYYYTCLNILQQRYNNLTAFVFSDNINWVKENLHLDVPTEFVSGNGIIDDEEFVLMSMCKHYIIPASTFSKNAAALSSNEDKKIFLPQAARAQEVNQYLNFLRMNKIYPLNSTNWIRVPFDFAKQPEITMRPIFSLLLVVNNDIATLPETLGTILNQDYKFYEVIIIDNASFDGSSKLCQQAAKNSDKVTLIKLYDKISDGAAWNMALNTAQGNYVMFLKGNDRLVVNALTTLYLANERVVADVVNSAVWLREDVNGNISQVGKKFVLDGDALFRNLKGMICQKFDKQTVLKILASNANFVPIASKVFKRKFLSDNAIRFDEKISDNDAKILFTTEAMLRTDDEMLILPNVFYVAPKVV